VASEVETSQPAPDATATRTAQPGPIQRGYCRLHRVALPNRYPVQPRPDLTVRRPLVVATRPGEELLCNCEHDGPHLWPDGDESGTWPDESVAEEPIASSVPD
jgi:hypothetical protein